MYCGWRAPRRSRCLAVASPAGTRRRHHRGAGDEICGKPAGEAAALAMLARLSGRTHRVLTAVALAHDAQVAVRLSVSEVRLRPLTDAEMRAYWDER